MVSVLALCKGRKYNAVLWLADNFYELLEAYWQTSQVYGPDFLWCAGRGVPHFTHGGHVVEMHSTQVYSGTCSSVHLPFRGLACPHFTQGGHLQTSQVYERGFSCLTPHLVQAGY